MTRTKLMRPNRKYAGGGLFSSNMDDEEKKQYAQGAGIISSVGSGIIDAAANRNDFGNMSTGAMMGEDALQGAAMGSQFGPLGTVAGGVLGAGLGLIQGGKLRREEWGARADMRRTTLNNENNYSAGVIAANPETIRGYRNASMFAGGGDLRKEGSSAGALFRPESYGSFGAQGKLAYDQGWMPVTSDNKTFRNRYGLMDKVVVPGDARPGYVGVNANGNRLDVSAFNADGKPFGEKMISGGTYDDVNKYFSSGNNVIAQRANQIGTRGFATGGQLQRPDAPLSNTDTSGGSATSLSSDSVQFNGNSHEQGGIQIPQVGAEVEGGETAKGSYVFSKELGFAKLHRPIAKAIGKIEVKPQTPDRVEALKLLKGREDRLMQTQEVYKHLNGIS